MKGKTVQAIPEASSSRIGEWRLSPSVMSMMLSFLRDPIGKLPYDNRSALEVIVGMAEKGIFSWDAIRALVGYNRKVQTHYSETSISTEKRGTAPPDNFYGIIAEEKPDQ